MTRRIKGSGADEPSLNHCWFCKRPFGQEDTKRKYVYPVPGLSSKAGALACSACYPMVLAEQKRLGLIVQDARRPLEAQA